MVDFIGRWDVNQKQSKRFGCFRTIRNEKRVTYTPYIVALAWMSVRVDFVQICGQTRPSLVCSVVFTNNFACNFKP